MKITKILLPLYNSIIIFTLITVWFLYQSYSDLVPILLLIPVWIYFVISTVDKIINFEHYSDNNHVSQLIRTMRGMKVYSFIIVLLIIFANLAYSSGLLESSITIIFLPLLASFFTDIFNKANYSQFKIKNIINFAKLARSSNQEIAEVATQEKDQEDSVVSDEIKEEEIAEDEITEDEIADDEELGKIEDSEVEKDESSIAVEEADVELDTASSSEDEEVEAEYLKDEGLGEIKDYRRRQFLKIIGGGGVSMFLMLFVYQQKASAAFFGSGGGPGVVAIKDSAGTKIDPAEKQPTDGYNITELDDSSSPSYYGFVHKNGNWYIAKEDSSGSYRYANGTSNFSANWAIRAALSYDYFDNVF